MEESLNLVIGMLSIVLEIITHMHILILAKLRLQLKHMVGIIGAQFQTFLNPVGLKECTQTKR